MKQKNFFKIAMLFVFVISSNQFFGQEISDNFEDGNLTGWTEGTASDWVSSTTTPITGTHSLKHNLSTVSGSSYISQSISGVDFTTEDATWQFNIKNGAWDPSSGNKFWIYLAANEADLGSASVDGYAIGVNLTGSSDDITLWKVTNGSADEAVISTSIDWSENETRGFKVTRSSASLWEVLIDNDGGSDALVSQGTATNSDYTDTTAFGLSFTYTSSRAGDLWMDDILVEASAPSTDPTVTFDAATSTETETDTDVITTGIPITLSNYDIDVTVTATVNGSSTAEGGDYTIDLTPLTFDANETLYIPLTIKDDADFDDETIIIDFTVTSGTADIGTSQHTVTIIDDETAPVPSLIITEVADPSDQYKGRFVEIYNNGATDINLATEQIYIAFQVNGGDVYSRALSGTLAANEVMIIGNSSNINTYYGFSADEDYGTVDGNGDDGYFLYHGGSHSSGTLFDSYGVLGVDGTSEDWKYENTRAYRNLPKSASPNATWTLAEWTVESTDKNLIDMTPGALEDEFRYDGDWKPRDVYANSSATDDVYISSSVTLSANLSVTNFEIETDQIATINSGGSLIVSGTSTGNVTYNRTVDYVSGNLRGWYLMSSPVVGQVYDDTYVTANDIAVGTGANRGIATYTTGSDEWAYHQGTTSATFITGKGYAVKRETNTGTVSFTGTLNTNDAGVDFVLDNTGNRINLLGNPYTSSISSNTLLANAAALSLTQTMWIYDQTIGTNGGFAVSTLFDNFILAPGQGFFVIANIDGGTVNFAEANQSHNADTFQRTANTEIKVQISVDGFQNYAKVYYSDNATIGFDVGYEGELFGGTSDSFSIYTQLLADNIDKKYQVQSLPKSDYENMIIPVGISADAGKEITFTAEALNLPSGLKVFLEDRQTNTFTRLDENNSNYKITLNADSNGIGRFYLHTSTSNVLSTDNFNSENLSIYKLDNSTIRITGLERGKTEVSLYNILGEKIMNQSFNSNGIEDIPLPKVSTGIYIIKLQTETGIISKKIILE
jgi:hypothetical protein